LKHIENTRRQIGELAELSAKTEAAEQRILESAEKHLAKIQARIAELRPRAVLDQEAGEEYQKLTAEQNRLGVVIATAKKHLAA
jgi:hypothetical protein